jgi:hypothetical protein
MRILHVTILWEYVESILTQLETECRASNNLAPNHSWDTVLFFGSGNADFDQFPHLRDHIVKSKGRVNSAGLLGNFRSRYRAFKWIKSIAGQYDFVLLRYPFADPLLFLLFYQVRNIVTVHHTNELREIRISQSLFSSAKYLLEKYLGPAILRRARAVTGVTTELATIECGRFEGNLPTCIYPNGMEELSLESLGDNRSGTLKLIFVVSRHQIWHGLDVILDCLSANNAHELHIVGNIDGFSHPHLLSSSVKLHGVLEIHDLNDLFSHMDVGLSTMALSRKGMTEACPLKSRHYLQRGVAVYGNYIDPCFSGNFLFYMNGPMNSKTIMEYGYRIRRFKRSTIRESSIPLISKRILMNQLIDKLNSIPA